MSRSAWFAGIFAALAAGSAGYWAGHGDNPVPAFIERARTEFAYWLPAAAPPPAPSSEGRGPVVYYQDPDGKPVYALAPTQTLDGRDFRPVHANEEVRFDTEENESEVAPQVPAATADATAPAESKRILYYRNPMGLPDTSPVPKKDSMGMDYLPVYAGEDTDDSTIKISPGKIQRTGVRSETVERRVVTHPVRVPGTVQLDERRVTVVATRSEAYVDHVENVTTGDRVRKSQPLVQVYSPEINAAAAQLIANPGFDGSRRRLQNLNVSAEAIAEMERTRRVPMAVTWVAPRDGVVLERRAIEGMKAAAGDTLFRIGDISLMWVLADVPEVDLGHVRVGQSVMVRVRSLPSRTFAGKISMIYPQVNKDTRTTRVRIELPNLEGVLLPEMYAEVDITTSATKPVVAVPDDAVIDTGTRQVVILDRGDGRFEPREVTVGARGNGFVEIRAGLQAGTQVVTAANFLIDAESNLKAALQSMAAPPPAQAAEVAR